jgi:hypothetical protein
MRNSSMTSNNCMDDMDPCTHTKIKTHLSEVSFPNKLVMEYRVHINTIKIDENFKIKSLH